MGPLVFVGNHMLVINIFFLLTVQTQILEQIINVIFVEEILNSRNFGSLLLVTLDSDDFIASLVSLLHYVWFALDQKLFGFLQCDLRINIHSLWIIPTIDLHDRHDGLRDCVVANARKQIFIIYYFVKLNSLRRLLIKDSNINTSTSHIS